MTEMIVAVFTTAHEADLAVRDLEANLPGAIVQRRSADVAEYREPSFWDKLVGREAAVYERSVSAGGVVVTVTVGEGQYERAVGILEGHHPVDLDERAVEYGLPVTTGPAVTGARGSEEEVVPLHEEEMRVGKRVVDRGSTRLRVYTVAEDVAEPVTLREERVTVERRPATGAPAAGEAFRDRVVDVPVSGEEAVVGKTTRVGEEVVVRREGEERVETVRGTVRREEAEVERRGATGATGALRRP